MRVLMISIDRTLLGTDYSGDVLERHKKYAQEAGQLDIIVFTKKGFKKKEFGENLRVHPTNSKIKINYIFDAFEIAKNIYWPDKYDLIVCQDPFLTGLAGWFVKKRFKVPLLVHFHGDFWDNKYWLFERGRWWFNWLFLILSKFIVNGADGIRVVSSGIKDKLIKAGVPEKKVRIIPTPVNVEKFEKYDDRKIKRLRLKNKNHKTIINVGRKDPSKDYKTLFKTIELVYEDYKKLAFWQIGANIYLSGKIKGDDNLILNSVKKVKQKDLINYYHTSDVYVSSSCSESFGKVLVEAMASGLPVVATATTGSREVIEDGVNGFLVPIGDSEALAKKVLYLLNNPDKAEEIAQAGKAMVRERFNQEKIIEKIIKFWKDLS